MKRSRVGMMFIAFTLCTGVFLYGRSVSDNSSPGIVDNAEPLNKDVVHPQDGTKTGPSMRRNLMNDHKRPYKPHSHSNKKNDEFKKYKPEITISYKASNDTNLPLDRKFQYKDVSKFLLSTSDDVIIAPQVSYLRDVRNPCFALTPQKLNPINVTLGEALAHQWKVQCLPLIYEIGFTKSGTSDLFYQLKKHPMVLAKGKEMHWWDNMRCRPNYTISQLANNFIKPTGMILSSFLERNETTQYVMVEGTPRTVWHGDHWMFDAINRNLSEPRILMPHKMYHASPQSLIIVIMREPVSRLISDYVFYSGLGGRRPNADSFHEKISQAIAWWQLCLSKHSQRLCLYGPTPPGMPKLDEDECSLNRNKTWQYIAKRKTKHSRPCHITKQWRKNVAARLRVSLYEPLLADWLEVYPRDQILFLKFEEYIAAPFETLQNVVFPFVGLPQLTGTILKSLKSHLEHHSGSNRSGSKKFAAHPETLTMLHEFYAPYNVRLSNMLDSDKWLWMK